MTHDKNDTAPLAFVTGLALGATLTALFAPRSGDELRRTLKRKADGVRESLKETVDNVEAKVDEKVQMASKEAERQLRKHKQ